MHQFSATPPAEVGVNDFITTITIGIISNKIVNKANGRISSILLAHFFSGKCR